MPRNRLALAVHVGRQKDLVGLVRKRSQLIQNLFVIGKNDVVGCKISAGIDPIFVGGQIPDMALAGLHDVIGAEILVDGLRFGRLDRKKPVPEMFLSAVDEVRPVAEALGYAVDDVKRKEWKDYAHLGLQRIELSGHMSA